MDSSLARFDPFPKALVPMDTLHATHFNWKFHLIAFQMFKKEKWPM